MKRFVLFALLIGFVAMPLFAQNPTGTLSGHASDGKDPLPGVTVTATSPNLQGARTSVTNGNGDYIFTFLPPGEYRVRFELQGFQTIDTTVKINAAQTQRVNATMPQAKVAEEVTVTGAYDTIASSGTMATTYEKSLINKLPVPKDLDQHGRADRRRLHHRPQRQRHDRGRAVVREPVHGQRRRDHGQRPRHAEHALHRGRGPGDHDLRVRHLGRVRPLHRRRGQHAHQVGRQRVPRSRCATPSPTTSGPPRHRSRPRQRLDKILNQYEATLGGFIVKDRLWFFGAYRDRKTSSSRPDLHHQRAVLTGPTPRSATRAS